MADGAAGWAGGAWHIWGIFKAYSGVIWFAECLPGVDADGRGRPVPGGAGPGQADQSGWTLGPPFCRSALLPVLAADSL